MALEFHCSVCKNVKDVRVLRASVCPECREQNEREDEAVHDAAAGLKYAYERALEKGPHYTGLPEAWTPKDPVLLADREHFICSGCKKVAHLVHDLSIRWNKKPYPIPNKYSLCDACHRRDLEDSATSTYTNRFSRNR
jgi:hypothetical protein